MNGPVRVITNQEWPAFHRLLHTCFAGMVGRIDPPSSLHRLTLQDIADFARDEILLAVHDDDNNIVACLFCSMDEPALYLGKLAVAPAFRGRGYARSPVDLAEDTARVSGLDRLRVQTRVELTENHATFAALGFTETVRTAHPGFDRPTSITFERPVSPETS